MVPGLPQNVEKKPEPEPIGCPKPILKAHSTHTIRTTAKAANVSIMLLIDQRFCMTPPYSTTSPGTLISPTSVAAVICQALSPGLSQVGYGSNSLSLSGRITAVPRTTAGPTWPRFHVVKVRPGQ